MRLDDPTFEPSTRDPSAHLVPADVEGLGQERRREPFPALPGAKSEPAQHRPDGTRRSPKDSRYLLDRNGIDQIGQTLLLRPRPLAIASLRGESKPPEKTQAGIARIPRYLLKPVSQAIVIDGAAADTLHSLLAILSDQVLCGFGPPKASARTHFDGLAGTVW